MGGQAKARRAAQESETAARDAVTAIVSTVEMRIEFSEPALHAAVDPMVTLAYVRQTTVNGRVYALDDGGVDEVMAWVDAKHSTIV